MRQTTSLSALCEALAAAQGEIEAAAKDRINPHFKSKYATLAAAVEASRPTLKKYGLAILQSPTVPEHAQVVTVTTRLLHKSGEWIEDDLTLPVIQFTPQGIGSAITYARRYAYCAFVGVVADEDDDGNAATGRNGAQQTARPVQTELEPEPWLLDLESATDEGMAALSKAFNTLTPERRRQLTASGTWEALKTRALNADRAKAKASA